MSITSWILPKAKTLVGVDIGTSAVKLAEVRPLAGGQYELSALGMEKLPADSIVDGVIISKLAVADAIEQLFRAQNVRNERIATSICGHSVIVKRVSLPVQNDSELEESIMWEAEQYIPFDISEVNLDYQVLRRATPTNRMDVLLVAAKRDKIADHTSVLSMAGKKPVVVDIDAFALQNAYQINYSPAEDTVVALLDIGCTMINVNLVQGKEFLFTRDIAMGGNHYTEFLQRELSIPFEEAEQYKKGETPSPEMAERTQQILEEVSEILTLEVQKTFDFFKTTSESVDIREVYLSGGASRTHGLLEFLQSKLELPVHLLNPFRQLKVKESQISSELLNDLATDFAIAIGLALRSERER